MSDRTKVTVAETPRPTRRRQAHLGLAIALATGALVTESIGLLERHMLASPHPIPYVHLFFSDPFYMKAWLASATLMLSFGQLVTAAGMFGVFHISAATSFYRLTHRWSGRVAMALTLPVAFNCLFDLGVNPLDWRIMAHATLGAFIYGIFVAKMLLVRQSQAPGWALPIAGSALFATILGLWITSAYWLFSLYGWHV
jgi:hypothetical protein